MKSEMIPGYVRSLANIILVNPNMNPLETNQRLHLLGWDEFELDYHTYQIAIACFDTEGLDSMENKSTQWFEVNFRQDNAGGNGYEKT